MKSTRSSKRQIRLAASQGKRRLFALCLLLCLAFGASAETPSSIMSKAMIAMMDVMGNMANQYKSKGNWSLGSGYSPYGLSTFNSSPWSLYSAPSGLYPGSGWPGGMPMQSPVPGLGTSPWQGLGASPWQGISPLASPYNQRVPERSVLDGIWLGQGGELVLVMYGHFRIYASAEVYRDGLYEINADRLIMYDPESENRMEFEYRLDEGRMILRSQSGAIMLFKQLPIPIPPQSLFAPQSLPYQ
jgi:hypothetical protein